MKKYEEISNPASCLNKAHDEEPLFIVRGKDPAAPATIRAWVHERVSTGINTSADAKIQSALQLALDVEAYQAQLATEK